MSKIFFTVFSQAYYVDQNWGVGCPTGGIRRMGDIFHNYNIPITWLVSPKSARCEQELFKEYHEKYGDEIAMMIRFSEKHHSSERAIAESWSKEKFKEEISKQKAEIEQYLPWADVKVAGQGIKNQTMYEALLELGFKGLYGHCYCQIGTDSITDFGMPWGSFRMRPSDFRVPSRENESGLIAFEWTMRDLNKSFHTLFPELWSTDPNDVERGGVCSDDNVEWWKNMFMQYERALKLNPAGIWFQYHQESHEMTWGEVCKPYTEERVMFTADMMDEFLDWLGERESVEFLTASAAIDRYNEACLDFEKQGINNSISKEKEMRALGTIPMFNPSMWTDVPENLPFWEQVRSKSGYAGQISKHHQIPIESLYEYLDSVYKEGAMKAMKSPKWLDSFFFFDEDCQLVFDINKAEPVAIFNYLNYTPSEEMIEQFKGERGGGMPGFYLEESIPDVKISTINDGKNSIKVEVESKYPIEKELPFGVFLWNEFLASNSINPSSAILSSTLGTELETDININHKKLNIFWDRYFLIDNIDNKELQAFESDSGNLRERLLLKIKESPDQGVFLRFNLPKGLKKMQIAF